MNYDHMMIAWPTENEVEARIEHQPTEDGDNSHAEPLPGWSEIEQPEVARKAE